MSSCQISAVSAERLQSLLNEGYEMCGNGVNSWYDNNKSWADVAWFTSTLWSRNINQGQQLIFSSQQVLFMIVSVIANAKIMSFHYTTANHPKFALTFFSLCCIRIHVLSGSIGVLFPLYVFFAVEQELSTRLMFIFSAWDFVFAASAFIQAPNVYGVRVLTIPMYYSAIIIKVILNACLLQSLLYEPIGGFKTQVQWLWMCWTIHQTYAWVRVWITFFDWADVLKDHQYTASVLLAGFMCLGAAVGFYFWLISMVITIAYFQYLEITARFMSKELTALSAKNTSKSEKGTQYKQERIKKLRRRAKILAIQWSEAQLNTFRGSERAKQIALKLCLEHNIDHAAPNVSDITPKSIKALMLFQAIDLDGDGHITNEEFENFLMGFGVVHVVEHAMHLIAENDKDNSGTIDLQEFESSFEPFYQYTFRSTIKLIKDANDMTVARNIFMSMAPEDSAMNRGFKALNSFGSGGCPFKQIGVTGKNDSPHS